MHQLVSVVPVVMASYGLYATIYCVAKKEFGYMLLGSCFCLMCNLAVIIKYHL